MSFISRLIAPARQLRNPIRRTYMDGPGSRNENNALGNVQGLTRASLKHHRSLVPLFVIVGGALVIVAAYIGRLAILGSDVSWRKIPEPNNDWKEKQFKMYSPSMKREEFKTAYKGPNYRED